MSVIGQGISLIGLMHDDFNYPFFLASATVVADVGKPMSLDTTAANTMKNATDGEVIRGQLVTFEHRVQEGGVKVGTIQLKGAFRWPVKSGSLVVVGSSVVGAGNGEVRLATAGAEIHNSNNVVVEVSGGFATVLIH